MNRAEKPNRLWGALLKLTPIKKEDRGKNGERIRFKEND
jgi:hypothetical protein